MGISNGRCVLDYYPSVFKKASKVSRMQVAGKALRNKAKKRISARQQLFHSYAVMTAVTNLMDKKSLVRSGRSLSTKKQEEIECDTNKLSQNLRQLIALNDDQNTVEQMKAFMAKLDTGMVVTVAAFSIHIAFVKL